MIARYKPFILSRVLYGLFQIVSSSSPSMLIRYLRLAEMATNRPHYKRAIREIRDKWLGGHPSMRTARKILGSASATHLKMIVRNFIINQLLEGSARRKRFSEEQGGFYPPGLLVLSPSMKCNLKCFGCYAGKYDREEDLPFEVVDRVLTEAKEMGIYFVVVSGGEPFFRKDIFDIFEKHNDMSFHVFTHGGLLDESRVRRLAELGNVLPAISVEGFRRETDERRGEGHYDRVLRAMDNLRKAGILFSFSATMTRRNADTLVSDEFVDHWMERGCVIGWYFLYMPVGRDPEWSLVPTPEQRDLLRRRVKHFRDTKEMFFGDFWNDGPVVGGCIAGGRKYLHINSKGDVEPCVFCHFSMHNIKEVPLREAVTSPLFRKIRGNQACNSNLLRPCMIIDHPEQYREVCRLEGVKFTHEGADRILTEFAEDIDSYAQHWEKLADAAWDEKRAERC